MNKYDELDALIVYLIGDGYNEFTYLLGQNSAGGLANMLAHNGNGYRLIDRRLQSLRKRGVIEYAKGKWRVI